MTDFEKELSTILMAMRALLERHHLPVDMNIRLRLQAEHGAGEASAIFDRLSELLKGSQSMSGRRLSVCGVEFLIEGTDAHTTTQRFGYRVYSNNWKA